MTTFVEREGPHRNHGCRIRDFTWHGYRCLSMENASIRVVICPDKGCDILEFTYKPSDTELLYQAPSGLGSPHDRFVPAPGGPFRDRFAGGWFLMLPNGPEPCTHRGAESGHHGEASQLAWSVFVTQDRAEQAQVVFRVRLRRMPLLVERTLSLERDDGRLTIVETLVNEGGESLDVVWGHHPCLGEPFLEPGCRISLPDGRETGIDAPVSDFRTVTALTGQVAVTNPRPGLDFTLAWDPTLFPVMGLWRVWDEGEGYPNYASRRIVALEPAIDFPSLSEAVARGTALRLAPGAHRTTTLTARVSQHPKA